jgi:hypothetical protein
MMISVLQDEIHMTPTGHKYWLNHFKNTPIGLVYIQF